VRSYLTTLNAEKHSKTYLDEGLMGEGKSRRLGEESQGGSGVNWLGLSQGVRQM